LKPVSTGILAAALAGFALMSGAALAQQAADAPAAPPAPPEVKAVGDWQVRCFAVKNGHPCDMFQEMASKDSRQRLLSFSLAYDPGLDRHLMQITVPLDVSLQKGLTIQTDNYTSPVLKFRMCTREGCFVQLAPENAMIDALAKSGPDAKLNIVADGNGKSYALQFSLKGFSAAHDDMVAQARAKAKPAAKTGDAVKP
jgi:invasion protein IalB